MSRYEVAKVFREVVLGADERQRFLEDPDTFLAGRNLTDEERVAIVERDCGTLYRLGNHPFLLWCWIEQISSDGMMTLVHKYVDAIAPYGVVDYET